MRKLIVFLLALASAMPLYALPDQVQQTIAACGKPVRSYLGPTDASAPVAERILVFRDGHSAFFDRSSGVPIFRRVSNGNRAFRTLDEARSEMPCLAKTDFAAPVGPAPLSTRHNDAALNTAVAGVGFFFIVMVGLGIASYFLPCIVVAARKVDNPGGIIALNILLGWTLVGWVIALVWAFSKETRAQAAMREMAYRNMAMQQPYPPQTYNNPNLPR